MKALIQRVFQASVAVEMEIVGDINHGILAYIGIGHNDTVQQGQQLVDKILTYRIFENEAGKLDKNVQQVAGGLLLVSQFTLMAKTDKGRRPDFSAAMPSAASAGIFETMIAYAKAEHHLVASGVFGATMLVKADNDGPLNFMLEVR